jgi:outer membrane protein assembly factor BamB
MKTMKRSVTTLTAVIMTAAVAAAGDWPNWRGQDYDGISKEDGWNPAAVGKPEVAWKAEVGAGYSAVAVANGKVYTAGNFNKDTDAVSCLDAASGKLLWKHEYPESLAPKYYSGGCSATPTVADGKVYFASKSGKVFCLDADGGKVIWKTKFDRKMPVWGGGQFRPHRGQSGGFQCRQCRNGV